MSAIEMKSEARGDRYERDRDRDRSDRGGDKDDDRGGRRGGFSRKKVCRFCSDTEFVMDYKDQRMMQSFVTEHGKIVPRRISGNCARHQRKVTLAIKRARTIALLPFTVTA